MYISAKLQCLFAEKNLRDVLGKENIYALSYTHTSESESDSYSDRDRARDRDRDTHLCPSCQALKQQHQSAPALIHTKTHTQTHT